MIWYVSKWFKMGFFFNFHCENLVELLEANLTEVWPCPPGGHSSQLCLSLQQLVSYGLGFLSPYWSPWRFLLMGFCSSELWFSVPSCMSLQFLRTQKLSTSYILSSFHLYDSSIIFPILQWRNWSLERLNCT